jgi:hypothetical protein
MIKEKALQWALEATSSRLGPRALHFSVKHKFWPKVKYGLCANTAPYDTLVEAMHKPYWLLAPIGGLIRSARREIRFLDTGFYGNGFPHWGIEALIEETNKILIHFGTKSLIGVQLQLSMELLTLELGLSSQPFTISYQRYHNWVTDCFLKEWWSRLDRFGFKVHVQQDLTRLPRTGDRWLMTAFEEAGYTGQELVMLNLIRNHQQVVFESDIFGADGVHVDKRYLTCREHNACWSRWKFSKQKPTSKHLQLWLQAIGRLTAPGDRHSQRL